MRSSLFSKPGARAPGPPLTLTTQVTLDQPLPLWAFVFLCARRSGTASRTPGTRFPRLTLTPPHLLPDPSQP